MKNAKLKQLFRILYYSGLAFLIARIVMRWSERPEMVYIFGWVAVILLVLAGVVRALDYFFPQWFRSRRDSTGIEE